MDLAPTSSGRGHRFESCRVRQGAEVETTLMGSTCRCCAARSDDKMFAPGQICRFGGFSFARGSFGGRETYMLNCSKIRSHLSRRKRLLKGVKAERFRTSGPAFRRDEAFTSRASAAPLRFAESLSGCMG